MDLTGASDPLDDGRFDYTAYGLDNPEKDYPSMPLGAKCPCKSAGTK
jgi:hypothetical protein